MECFVNAGSCEQVKILAHAEQSSCWRPSLVKNERKAGNAISEGGEGPGRLTCSIMAFYSRSLNGFIRCLASCFILSMRAWISTKSSKGFLLTWRMTLTASRALFPPRMPAREADNRVSWRRGRNRHWWMWLLGRGVDNWELKEDGGFAWEDGEIGEDGREFKL